MPHSIVTEELALLKRIVAYLAALPPRVPPSLASIEREIARLREVLSSGREGKDSAALSQQLHRETALLDQLRASSDAGQIDPRSPYFAHLQLREDGHERDLCLGRATCIGGGVRIVDWRNAPISRLFYRYQQGDDYEEEIAGRLRIGEIASRRTLAISDGRIEQIDAPEGTFIRDGEAPSAWRRLDRATPRLAGGEASALRAHRAGRGLGRRLGGDGSGAPRRADKHLPEITSLIDPDQFRLITRQAAGFLAIRGSAGSGKTTVALHRIAYLAFDDPEIDSRRTLFVVFSPGLRNYVGHVLPALGVDGVRVVTYHEWVTEQRRRHFPRLPAETRDDAPAAVQRLKLHPALSVALAEQVRRVSGSATAAQALDDWASVLTQGELLAGVCARVAPGAFAPAEIDRFVDWNRRRNEELFARLEGDAEAEGALDPEDETLLLRAWQLRVGPLQRGRRALRYVHLAIDEVQDFAPIEVQVLLDCLDRRRSITLAGDTQQHLVADSGFTSWSDFLERLGVEGAEVETLRVSYRSSREIVSFARSLLGDLAEDDEPPLTTRSGPAVELFRFSDRGACVAFLADALGELRAAEPLASVAVLTPSPEASALYAEGLLESEVPEVRRVENQDFTFAPGVEVTEVEQVKGLEFDYVVLVDVGLEVYPEAPVPRRRLHVGATRAVHQLWLTCVGTPSPVVASLIAEPGRDETDDPRSTTETENSGENFE